MQDDPDPLSGLDDIDWANLEHAYGPAADVPDQLRDLATGDASSRQKALSDLWGNIHHQGTVYEASAHAVPFLARIAASETLPAADRADLISLISAIASGSSYLDVHAPLLRGGLTDEQQEDLARELEWAADAHEAAVAVAPSLLKDLQADDHALAWALVGLTAQVPEVGLSTVPILRTMLDTSTHPMRRKAVELTLALIDGSIDADDIRGVASLDQDLASLADPSAWKTVEQGAQYIVAVLLEEAGESE